MNGYPRVFALTSMHRERYAMMHENDDLGACRLPSLDDVAEALAVAEGDDFS